MDSSELRQILSELRFSAGLSDAVLHELAEVAQLKNFRAGESLFAEGHPADELYLVLDGRVELCMNVPAGGCLPILTLESGDLVGWSAFARDARMTATAVATTDTQVIAIPAAELIALCERDHDVGYAILHRVVTALARRLVATRLQVLDLFADVSPGADNRREVRST